RLWQRVRWGMMVMNVNGWEGGGNANWADTMYGVPTRIAAFMAKSEMGDDGYERERMNGFFELFQQNID
ncbi:MAG: hypothetical protein RSI33_08495, partial [Clostridia bacterium]